MTTSFSIRQALRFGWQKTKKHFWFLVVVFLGTLAVSLVLNMVAGDEDAGFPRSVLGFLISMVVGVILEIGTTKIALKILADVRGGVEDFLADWELFWNVLVVSILYGLIVIAGLILLIVPGIILALRYYFASYLVIDKGMRPMAALRRSAEITKGQKGRLLLFIIATIGVVLLGALALLVGLLWAIPTAMIAIAWVYRKLEGGQEVLPLAEAKD